MAEISLQNEHIPHFLAAPLHVRVAVAMAATDAIQEREDSSTQIRRIPSESCCDVCLWGGMVAVGHKLKTDTSCVVDSACWDLGREFEN